VILEEHCVVPKDNRNIFLIQGTSSINELRDLPFNGITNSRTIYNSFARAGQYNNILY